MGTRADFYVGRGEQAEWIGSQGYDGYPEGQPDSLLKATTEGAFRAAVAALAADDDFTKPEQGWPWPWDDSQTTDFAYAFDGDQVYVSCFGHGWATVAECTAEDFEWPEGKSAVFPNMTERKNNPPLGDKRSGLMVIDLTSRP